MSKMDSLHENKKKVFLENYDLHSEAIFKHIFYRTNQKEIAEDLFSQVFTNSWEYLKENEISNFKAFFYRTANNLVIDWYRQKAKPISSLNELNDDEKEIEIPSETDIEEEISQSMETENLMQLVNALPDDYRNLLLLRYVDDLSIPEISNISGKSPSAIYVGLHRAIKMIKKSYEEQS